MMSTYTCELDTAVTTLWCCALLLEVEVSELTAWGLDHSDLVGTSVVSMPIVSAQSWYLRQLCDILRATTGAVAGRRKFLRVVELTAACGAVN